jgi:alpha-tubulin suppressor-like RCC1 family protein
VGLGQLHSCICDQAKQAWCWGRNKEAQLGTGDVTPSLIPTPVPALVDCEQIAGGAHHTCALRTDKTVWCWGQNTDGQTGQPAGAALVMTPQMVPGLSDVAEVQCGEMYTCARKADGTILCWGRNESGQLGDGTMTARSTPAPVSNLTTDIAELAAGRFFACVRHTSGQISCWGNNSNGQLGVATPATSSVPVPINGITDALQVTASHQHACVIHRATGVVSCWGGNLAGQLGDGTMTNSLTPVDVVQIVGVTSVAAGAQHTCASHSKGVSCWGDNLVNQLGDGGTTNRSRPVTVSGFNSN